MKLSLKNIGKIKNAEVEINGITVIAGENNTGKSTVGKALFTIFNSLYKINEKIINDRMVSINRIFDLLILDRDDIGKLDSETFEEIISFSKKLAESRNDYLHDENLLQDEIKNFMLENLLLEEIADEEIIENLHKRIKNALEVTDGEIVMALFNDNLNKEFGNQVTNIYADDRGSISLDVKNDRIEVTLDSSVVVEEKNAKSFFVEAVYIDDPFVIDDLSEPSYYTFSKRIYNRDIQFLQHRSHLLRKLKSEPKSNLLEEILVNKRFEDIYNKMNSVCSGDIVSNKRRYVYAGRENDKSIDIRNLSTGMKTFVILKRLLVSGVLVDNGTIILDEPEIHLHPEWQLVFAELIVLIQKEFNMHILLNTHSPYFLDAIEVFSSKYGIVEKCKYYLAKNEGESSVISDVTGNIDQIYRQLARPLQDLENLRWGDE